MTTSGRCRSCGLPALHPVLDLGLQPLANALRDASQLSEPESRFPLKVVVCAGCTLVQITETVPPAALFGEYPYFSSFSDTMLEHARRIAQRLAAERKLGASSLVVEIASNDGYLLQYYRDAGVPVLGVEPAANIARVAQARSIPTIEAFFDRALGHHLARTHGRADVVHANNVLAHVPDLDSFVQGLGAIIKQDGIGVIEVPYVRDMMDRCEFDTIYHEHIYYFSLTALSLLLPRHDLAIEDVERLPIHGGSLRLHVGEGRGSSAAVSRLLAEESDWVRDPTYYARFASRATSLADSLRRFLAELRQSGARIAAYGAAAKGATLLNFARVDARLIEFVADRNPAKQGRYLPGVEVPIVPAERLLQDQPDYCLILPWNLADEIVAQQAEYARRGGRFIVAVPQPRVL